MPEENKGALITATEQRILRPTILQTKEELRLALKAGKIKSSKYNLLSDQEQTFVDLVCFGGYSGEQAMRVLCPHLRNAKAAANRMFANPDVVDTIDELTTAKDRRFSAELASAKDMALERLQYIMMTTKDEALAASCAKILLDKGEAYAKNAAKKDDEQVSRIQFAIKVENTYVPGAPSPNKDEPVIIELPDDESKPKQEDQKADSVTSVDPNTGLPYVLRYEGVDNYN